MFIATLTFSTNKAAAPEFMAAHNAWIGAGFSDGVFQCVGSLQPDGGGAILAVGESWPAFEERINQDPFVQHDVVVARIIEVGVKKTAPAFDFLKVRD